MTVSQVLPAFEGDSGKPPTKRTTPPDERKQRRRKLGKVFFTLHIDASELKELKKKKLLQNKTSGQQFVYLFIQLC